MTRLAEEGTCPAFEEATFCLVDHPERYTNGDILAKIFRFMKNNYRNEYIYKSLLLKKIVYGRHSPKTTSALCELPIADSIADFVLINGKACVYEIKTDLDNLTRLRRQIDDYYRAFRYVSVVCSERAAMGLVGLLEDSPVGLMVLTEQLTFKTLKEPTCWTADVDAFVQFDLLRKKERENVLLRCGMALPEVRPVQYYAACLELFERLERTERCTAFEAVLKERGSLVDQAALELYPEEFKLVAYNHGANVRQGARLREFVRSKYK